MQMRLTAARAYTVLLHMQITYICIYLHMQIYADNNQTALISKDLTSYGTTFLDITE